MKIHLLAVSFAMSVYSALAAEVAPGEAEYAVGSWLLRDKSPLGTGFRSHRGRARRFVRADGRTLGHVVAVEGGGYVVTAGDTRIEPIVCFSPDGDLNVDDGPLAALIRADLEARLELVEEGVRLDARGPLQAVVEDENRLLVQEEDAEAEWDDLLDLPLPSAGLLQSFGGQMKASSGGFSSISDVRVKPMVKAKWDQSTFGRPKKNTFNYYTPYHYVCGCVATAFAQVMRHWKYPTKSVTPQTFQCSENLSLCMDQSMVFLFLKNHTMKGGKYDWSKMPYTSSQCTSTTQRKALGKLTYDVGVVSQMDWDITGSGTWGTIVAERMGSVFGYKSAMSYRTLNETSTPDANEKNAIYASLDAGMPVVVGIRGGSGGHEVVLDGYGYKSKKLYTHVNCGWSGSQNVWYAMFGGKVTRSAFKYFNEVNYNIHPTKSGTILSGRVTSGGKPVKGAVVTLADTASTSKFTAKTNAKGIYAIRFTKAGTFRLSASTSSKASTVKTVKLAPGQSAGTTKGNGRIDWASTGTVGNRWGTDLSLSAKAKVKAADGKSSAGVKLTWNKVSGAKGYVIYRDGVRLAEITGYKTVTYTDKTAKGGVKYGYSVSVVTASGGEIAGSADKGWVKPCFKIDRTKQVVDRNGGTLTFKVTSNVDWGVGTATSRASGTLTVGTSTWANWSIVRKVPDSTLTVKVYRYPNAYLPQNIGYAFKLVGTGKVADLSAAVWQMPNESGVAGTYAAGTFKGAAATTYDGYVYDAALKQLVGTLTVSAAKKKSGKSAISASVVIGTKKYAYSKGTTTSGAVKGLKSSATGAETLTLKLGADGLKGTYGSYEVYGSRRGICGTDYSGDWTTGYVQLAGDTGLDGRFRFKVADSGSVRVTAVAPNAKSASASAWLVAAADGSAHVPVQITMPNAKLVKYLFRLKRDGTLASVQFEEGSPCPTDAQSDGGRAQDPTSLAWQDTYVSPVFMVGVGYAGYFSVNARAYPAVFTATGLPPGLSCLADTGAVTGAPTAAGGYSVEVSVRRAANPSAKPLEKTFSKTVQPLAWQATGTFAGTVTNKSGAVGISKVSVSGTGRISGSCTLGGKTWKFSASNYARGCWDRTSGSNLVISATATCGKKEKAVSLVCAANGGQPIIYGSIGGSTYGVLAVRSLWDRSELEAKLSGWQGVYSFTPPGGGSLTLTVGKDGVAKVAGKLKNGRKISLSTQVLVESHGGGCEAVLYAPAQTVSGKSYKEFSVIVKFDKTTRKCQSVDIL